MKAKKYLFSLKWLSTILFKFIQKKQDAELEMILGKQ